MPEEELVWDIFTNSYMTKEDWNYEHGLEV